MVINKAEANLRHGLGPTYKKKKDSNLSRSYYADLLLRLYTAVISGLVIVPTQQE